MASQSYQFEVALPVADYDGSFEDCWTHLEAFRNCSESEQTAKEIAVGEIAAAGYTARDYQLDVRFVEFDSPNPSHACGYFQVTVTGPGVEEIQSLHSRWLASVGVGNDERD